MSVNKNIFGSISRAMSRLSHKLNRYLNLVKHFSNWPQYLLFKLTATRGRSFAFQLRNSFKITVPANMLGPFRECFLDELYLKHIDVASLQKKDLTIIDIGANVGYFALFMFYKFPRARILSFEPIPYCFNVLKNYQQQYPAFNWKVFQNAITDKDATIEIYTDKENDFSTTSSLFFTDKAFRLEVTGKTLQHFIDAENIDSINFLKLDCEGAEYSILHSLPESIWQKVENISLEAHHMAGEGENTENLVSFLKTKGFTVDFVLKRGAGMVGGSRVMSYEL